MSERARVGMIFVIVGLLLVGAGYWFLAIHRPRQMLRNAQDEITGWERRFQAARDCLLGAAPGSARTSEALTIHEMSPDPWDRKSCTPMIGKLSRGNAPESGIDAVEQAWMVLEKAASKAAQAYALHVVDTRMHVDDKLPEALDDLDAARLALRTAAHMPPTTAKAPALPTAQLIPLADGTDKVTKLGIDAIPSAHGVVLFGNTSSRTVQVTLTAGATPSIARVGPAAMRSVPDGSWGAVAREHSVDIGAVDGEGLIAGDIGAVVPLPAASPPTVAAIAGTRDAGIVVYSDESKVITATTKAGVPELAPAIDIDTALTANDVDGRVALVWYRGGNVHVRVLRPGAVPEPDYESDGAPPRAACLTNTRVWIAAPDLVYAADPKRIIAASMLDAQLVGCTAEAALIRNPHTPVSFDICIDECRTVDLPSGAPETATATVVNGKLVLLWVHNGVLGVWPEVGAPRFYSLPPDVEPALSQDWTSLALTDGKTIDVLAHEDQSFMLIRVPAT